MNNIAVEDMTDIEIIESKLDNIDKDIDTIYKTVENIFKASDKGKVTTELKLLVNMGATVASIKICYNKLESQLELLKELQKDTS